MSAVHTQTFRPSAIPDIGPIQATILLARLARRAGAGLVAWVERTAYEAKQRELEQYLAGAKNLADVESRMLDLQRGH